MALIKTDTFPITRWWLKAGLEQVEKSADIFASSRLRDARIQLIAGANQLGAIKNWLLAADLIEGARRDFRLSHFGKRIREYDCNFERAATWWALHLTLCFSERSQPYPAFFRTLDPSLREWLTWEDIVQRVRDTEELSSYAQRSIENDLQAIRELVRDEGSLAGLGLVEVRAQPNALRVGAPSLPQESVLLALAHAKYRHFASRESVDFAEFVELGVHSFLCQSTDNFRKSIRSLSRSDQWSRDVTFNEQANLNSVSFSDNFRPDRMSLILLQQGKDVWR